MKNRKFIIFGILAMAFLFVIGASYALWQMTLQQETSNVVNTACFKINFQDQNEINLQSVYPISDEEGMSLTPYSFTIENICSTTAFYQINLEELTTELKKLSNEYIKVSLNNSNGKILDTYTEVDKTLENATVSHRLTSGSLKENESKTFELRLWLDENTPAISDAMNATFQSKITVIAVQKEGLPEVDIVARDNLNEITIDISTVKNPKNEILTYFYQLNEEAEIESEENTHTFTGLSDGKYKAKGRAETLDGVILEEKELEVTVAYETVYVSNTGNDITGNGAIDNPFASLQPAYNKVKSGGEILLLSDLTATRTTNMNIANKEVTLRSNGENIYTIERRSDFLSHIMVVENSNTLTTTNVTLDGKNIRANGSLIEARNSTLNLTKGTTIQNNIHVGNYNQDWKETRALGGGIYMYKGTINITEAIISNNQAEHSNNPQGGGIAIYFGTVNFNSGFITNNDSNNGPGGGIMLAKYPGYNANLYLQGGRISGNVASTDSDIHVSNGAQIIDQRTS